MPVKLFVGWSCRYSSQSRSFNTIASNSIRKRETITRNLISATKLQQMSETATQQMSVTATQQMSETATQQMSATDLSAAAIRLQFIDFFASRCGHTMWPSSPVVPHNDPTLLFNNAGMNQFKPIFLGDIDANSPFATMKRAVNTQKCIRAGGKHNDLEDVGKDVYHHTFFEMLGNWSFGDYFKEEAICWAWQLLTDVWKIPKGRLYATYFGGDPKLPHIPADTKALEIWSRFLPKSHILPFGCKDNFWEMGAVGPCGPCTEIHYDRVGGRDAATLVNMDDPEVLELWNLVFMQFNRERDGSLSPLPAPCVDTGMGLERLVSVLQNKPSNYDTELFTDLFRAIQKIIPNLRSYTGKSFIISYVLRRILRRAVRCGRQFLNAPKDDPWFFALVDSVVASLGGVFPELKKNPAGLKFILKEEEVQFSRTLDKGVAHFTRAANKLPENEKTFPGQAAFELYGTYGFPLDLTQLMAEELGMTVDVEAFEAAFQKHQKASENANFKALAKIAFSPENLTDLETVYGALPTDDSAKYNWQSATATGPILMATIMAIWNGSSFVRNITDATEYAGLILDTTSFYAESGGQVADVGSLGVESSDEFNVMDVKKIGSYVVHVGSLNAGCELNVHDEVTLEVDYARRADIAKNHTATHALNFALRKVLGNNCDQRGSLVEPQRARFDYAGSEPMTEQQIKKTEEIVREDIQGKTAVHMSAVSAVKAKEIEGLRAVFGEVYPDPVRVVSLGAHIPHLIEGSATGFDCSVEFCGGTHLANCCEMADFVVITEESISRGVRRLLVTTGTSARDALTYGLELTERIEACRELNGEAVDAVLAELRDELIRNKEKITMLQRKKCYEILDVLSRKRVDEGKQKTKMFKKLGENLGIKLGQQIKEDPKPYVIHVADELKGDFKSMEAAISAFKNISPALPILLLSHSATSTACLAHVPKELATELNAEKWVSATLNPLGGKAGGKELTARGVCPGYKTDVALKLSLAYIHKCCLFSLAPVLDDQ